MNSHTITKGPSEVQLTQGSVLQCQDLSYRYPNGKLVFKDINLLTFEDELVAIVGPTGTGKSTLLRCLGLLLRPTTGHDYLKEMSGGMRQRITIARALAASPAVILMDEPFVHLDEFTANSLRKEIYDLVFNPETSLKSAVLVSHNLTEVIELADRVYVMNGSPAKIVDVVKIELARPRSPRDPMFYEYADRLYAKLNMKEAIP